MHVHPVGVMKARGQGSSGMQEALWGVSGEMDGDPLKPSKSLWETFSPNDLVAKVELFLFQGQKGDPGLSPGKALDGAKVGPRDPSAKGRGVDRSEIAVPSGDCPGRDHS